MPFIPVDLSSTHHTTTINDNNYTDNNSNDNNISDNNGTISVSNMHRNNNDNACFYRWIVISIIIIVPVHITKIDIAIIMNSPTKAVTLTWWSGLPIVLYWPENMFL
ncbi:unnamed protein product [Schistosoma curassoni]|uniref:G_PROTEIN_RECEP_F1_2 domain-containing protein n=1 Tax=Schistosoma curassoni TaxID=6186 RepID=A0A183KYP3_9TREM|nr:unnamed protein product [Schistosoma curassoni]